VLNASCLEKLDALGKIQEITEWIFVPLSESLPSNWCRILWKRRWKSNQSENLFWTWITKRCYEEGIFNGFEKKVDVLVGRFDELKRWVLLSGIKVFFFFWLMHVCFLVFF
jgi:hypothetical protein